MNNPRGPVVVGLDGIADETANVVAAIDMAAREAIRREVALCLVFGQDTLPSWHLTCQILERLTARTASAYPHLAITSAILPGTAAHALVTAAATASLVVLAARPGFDDGDAIAGLVDTTMITRAPVVMVVPSGPTEPTGPDMRLLTTPLERPRRRQPAVGAVRHG